LGPNRISGKSSIVIAIILIIFISSYIYPNTQAQSNTSFSPKDQFLIPSSNGAISFAVNGSYSNATLENGSWAFNNLSINGSMPIRNFLVSAQNSNVTIFSYFSFNNTVASLGFVYAVEGKGKQIFNFGQQSHVNGVDWTVVKTVNRQNVFLTPGTDYTISTNGTIVVNGATGNFSIFHFNFFNNNLNTNLPFYEQHSVAIATSAAVAIVIVLAVVVAVRNRKYLAEKKLGAGALTKNIERSTLKDEEKT
jgi:hypothetical protein